MNGAPLFSIIMPVYNVEKYIAASVKSVAAQTERDFELILVDDGSKDDSVSVARGALDESGADYRVISQKNAGVGCARNTGLGAAKGKWILFLDSDDLIAPYCLKLYKKLSLVYPEAEMLFSDYADVTSQEALPQVVESERAEKYDNLRLAELFLSRKLIILTPGTLYSADFLRKNSLKFNEIRWSEDQYFIWQIIDKIKTAIHSECVTYYYLHRENSIMTSTPNDKTIEAYLKFKAMAANYGNGLMKRYLLPRWVLGTLHSAAKYNDFASWATLADNIEYKKNLRGLIGFKSIKINALSVLGLTDKKLLYKILRRK